MNLNQKGFVTRYWLAGAIVITVAVALLFPEPGRAIPKLHLIDIGVVVIMFLGSLKLSLKHFKKAASRFVMIILSALSVFALAPLMALSVAWSMGMDAPSDSLGVLICFAQASTLATAIVLTEVAGGDVALAMVITVVNNLLTVALTPLLFRLLAGAEIQIDYAAMAGEMSLKIVAPVVLAQVARRWFGTFAKQHKRKLSVVSQFIILMYIFSGVATSAEYLQGKGETLVKIVGLVVVLHGALLIANALVARLVSRSESERTAFVLCSSQKTLPAAMLIWKSYFSSLPVGPLVAVAYHMLQLVVDSIAAPGFKRLPLIRNRHS